MNAIKKISGKLTGYARGNPEKMKLNKISIITGFLVLAIIMLAIYDIKKYSNNIGTLLQAYKILPEPETFTELSFQDPNDLPSIVAPGQQYSLAFTIHNVENQHMDYPYEVYIKNNNKREIIDKNSVALNNDAYITIQEGFILNHHFKKSQVVVELTSKKQQIDFWIEEDSKTNVNLTPSITPKPTIKLLPLKLRAAEEKQYGGWYWVPSLKKSQIWLGKDGSGHDIWSDVYVASPSGR